MNFLKYQGAGNDFIIFDNRQNILPRKNIERYHQLCDRRFGIGGDGLMLLQNHDKYDFEMVYYNSDGKEGTMCGNGGRCIVAFAKKIGVIEHDTTFIAIDGVHRAKLVEDEIVNLEMVDVNSYQQKGNDYFLNTGSPHHVQFVQNIDTLDVFNEGRKIRYSEIYQPEGTNVNFVQVNNNNSLKVRTYERGVEEETFACGTGVVAATLATSIRENAPSGKFNIQVLGGHLKVSYNKASNNSFSNIWLEGPANFVFEGKLSL